MPILNRMIKSTFLLCLVLLAQSTSDLAPDSIPEDVTVFAVTFKDGRDLHEVRAAVMVKGDYLNEYDKGNPPAAVDLVYDTPWDPVVRKNILALNIKEIEPETSAQRRKRYEDSGYAAVGGTWVSQETIARADRKQALQDRLVHAQAEREAAYAIEATVSSGSAGGPGFVALWGRHIIIAIFGGVLMVITYRVCF